MASLRRSTAMPTDGATSRFLYTILKQLDHKSVTISFHSPVFPIPRLSHLTPFPLSISPFFHLLLPIYPLPLLNHY
jgi:hypothetical protein